MHSSEPSRSSHRPDTDSSEPAGKSTANGNGAITPAGRNGFRFNAPLRIAAPAARSRDLTLTEVVALLRTGWKIVRSRWLFGLAAAVVIAVGLGSYIVRLRPEYTAVTTMLAQSPLDQVLRTKAEARGAPQEQENFLRNHISVMQSRRFTVRLANNFTPEEVTRIMAPYLEPDEKPTRAAFEQLLASKISAARERGREFFTLSFSHADGDVAVLVADRISATYLKLVQDEMKQANAAAAALLREQAEQLQSEISKLEDERRDYRKSHNIISLESNQGILAERLRQIDLKRADARISRVQLETQLAAAAADLEQSPTPFANPLLANFANNHELREERDRLNAERAVLASRYGPNHPKMRDMESSLRMLQQNIERNFDLAIRDLKSRHDAARAIEEQLEQEFVSAFGVGIEIERLAHPYLVLGSEVEAKRTTLADLLRRVNTAGIVSQLPTDVMRVVDPAYLAEPRLSKAMLFWSVTILLALGGFIFVPLTLHLFDERIKSATDVEEELGKELLGGVPKLAHTRAQDRPHVVRDNLDQGDVEAFMAVVAQLELASNHPPPKAILVTSTISGEGKSTIVSNLAAGFTRLGKRAAIIDCDFRRPSQQRLHRVTSDRGLLNWARAGFPPDRLFDANSALGVQELADGTHLIPAGGNDPQPTHFLLAKETAALFEELKRRYDVVIIDTPPAGLFQDAMVLSRYAQETLFVAREGRASLAQVRRTIRDLDKTAAPVLGVVLNDFSFLSLNPRLAYGSPYRSYGYQAAGRSAAAPAKKPTLVG